MFEKVSESWGKGSVDRIKFYRESDDLELRQLVEWAERSAYPFADMEVSFFKDCGREPERWSFEQFYARLDQLDDVKSVSFDLARFNCRLSFLDGCAELYLHLPLTGDVELDDILGEIPEELKEKWRGEQESIKRLFRQASFQDELDPWLDDLHGWMMYKLYILAEGKEASRAVERFLKERPDLRCYREYGKSFLDLPTYLLIGSMQEAKDFSGREKELAAACRQKNIHVAGGSCKSFWDAFDEKQYWVSVREYPGSADDAATYGDVTLHCEDET